MKPMDWPPNAPDLSPIENFFGTIVVTPSNTVVGVGETLVLECRTNNESKVRKWTHFSTNLNTTNIYKHPNIIPLSFRHFNAEVNADGSGILYTSSTRPSDAGIYGCNARVDGKDKTFSAQVVVLDVVSLATVSALSVFLILAVSVAVAFCIHYKRRVSAKYATMASASVKLESLIPEFDTYEILPYSVEGNYEAIDETQINDDSATDQIQTIHDHHQIPTGYSSLLPTTPPVYSRVDIQESPFNTEEMNRLHLDEKSDQMAISNSKRTDDGQDPLGGYLELISTASERNSQNSQESPKTTTAAVSDYYNVFADTETKSESTDHIPVGSCNRLHLDEKFEVSINNSKRTDDGYLEIISTASERTSEDSQENSPKIAAGGVSDYYVFTDTETKIESIDERSKIKTSDDKTLQTQALIDQP